MAVLPVAVVLVFLTAFLDRTSVGGKMIYKQAGGYGCPLFGMSCKNHCKRDGFKEGFCNGRHLADCVCSGCKTQTRAPTKARCK
uniref:Putative tick defensin n=1 Tax=Rhipicephalus pulchellus TaxID=72859 RepID=L7MCG0_RHIPC